MKPFNGSEATQQARLTLSNSCCSKLAGTLHSTFSCTRHTLP